VQTEQQTEEMAVVVVVRLRQAVLAALALSSLKYLTT
jgi:hypothetical protein